MPRIIHIGVGNFHRAHQAAYTAKASGDWRITGVVMSNAALFDAMSGGRGYDLGIRGPKQTTHHHISSHDRMILAQSDPQAVIDAFIDPDVQVVTLTITEKGYCLDPATGMLDLTNPAIESDLAGSPRSALGLLAHGLSRRAKAGMSAVTVISCDNLSGNGGKLRGAVQSFAQHAGFSLDPATCFPDTMVDRITPATSDVNAPVMTEEFSEWVIEDHFAGLRPDWENVGVEFTADVAPFEMRKLRLLNAAHSWLAYAGQLRGHTYVHEAINDPALRASVERLWDEAQATLPETVQPSTPAYRSALIDRFAVKEMRHALVQIGADGSLKLRERIVPLNLAKAASPQADSAVAAWIAFVLKRHDAGEPLVDPNADAISKLIASAPNMEEVSRRLVNLIGVSAPPQNWLIALTQRVREFLDSEKT